MQQKTFVLDSPVDVGLEETSRTALQSVYSWQFHATKLDSWILLFRMFRLPT